MSEQLLRAIIRLFALLAKVDGVSDYEKNTIKQFLFERLNEESALKYLDFFNKTADEYIRLSNSPGVVEKEFDTQEIIKIGNQINVEFTHQQKIVLMLDLVALMMADFVIKEQEVEIVNTIGKSIRVNQDDIDALTAFALATKPSDFDNVSFLIIAAGQDSLPEKARFIRSENLEGMIAVLELKQATNMYFIKYIGPSVISLNNTPLKSGVIRMLPPGSAIRSKNTVPVYFSDLVSRYKSGGTLTRISFRAENIEYRFKNGKTGLRNINIREESGSLIGLMGSSGSGKSTLLNVLNGNEKPSGGKVTINGIDIHQEKEKIEGIIGYVPQDDLLMEDLTVYRNLYYAAKLCFNNLSESEIENLVNHTLSNLGLTETRDLKVGSPLEKTISGGQRKRLNIGLELLREPSVMFVDEPTSGLSSRDSENIMDLLKELSLKGKLIFVVIHQPSSDIFKMFDKLVILDVGGYQIFYGNPVEAVVYFKNAFNMIDSDQGACFNCGNVNVEQIFNIIETRIVNEYGKLTKERKVTPRQWNSIFNSQITINEIKESADQLLSTLHIPNRLTQFRLFSSRDFFSKISNTQYLIINLLQAPLLAFLLAFIVRYFPDIGDDTARYTFEANVNIPAYLFMSVIVALFMGLTVSAEEIIRDRKILKRESFLNLSRSSYLFSKIFILFSLSAVQTLTYTLIGNHILGIKDMFLPFWLIMFSTSCFANVLGLNISSAFNSAVTVYILIPILLIPQLLLSGVVVKFDELNRLISSRDKVPVIGEIMASRWAFEAAMVTQYKNNRFERTFYPIDQRMGQAEFKNLYFIPSIISRLDFCHKNMNSDDPEIIKQKEKNFRLLRNEIGKELSVFGENHFREFASLNSAAFDETTYRKSLEFLEILKKVYVKRYNDALHEKEDIIARMTNSPENRNLYVRLKETHRNARVEEMVKNTNEAIRIIEYDGELIQKIFPIFNVNLHPRHPFEFRTVFYAPSKYLMGRHIETLWFNIGIIWFMSVIFFITLYFDTLKWSINKTGDLFQTGSKQ